MRREPSFKSDDTVIWSTSILLAAILGGLAAYAVAVAAGSAPDLAGALREVVGLIGAGVVLIVLALQGRLVRAFLISFTAVFCVARAVATHGFTGL